MAAPFSVEHICELPCSLSVTNIVVRPCVAFLHSYDETTELDADPEEAFSTHLDAKEVAAVFSAPFHNFLKTMDEVLDGDDGNYDGDGHPAKLLGTPSEWYEGRPSTRLTDTVGMLLLRAITPFEFHGFSLEDG